MNNNTFNTLKPLKYAVKTTFTQWRQTIFYFFSFLFLIISILASFSLWFPTIYFIMDSHYYVPALLIFFLSLFILGIGIFALGSMGTRFIKGALHYYDTGVFPKPIRQKHSHISRLLTISNTVIWFYWISFLIYIALFFTKHLITILNFFNIPLFSFFYFIIILFFVQLFSALFLYVYYRIVLMTLYVIDAPDTISIRTAFKTSRLLICNNWRYILSSYFIAHFSILTLIAIPFILLMRHNIIHSSGVDRFYNEILLAPITVFFIFLFLGMYYLLLSWTSIYVYRTLIPKKKE